MIDMKLAYKKPSIILFIFVWFLSIFCYFFLSLLETLGAKSLGISRFDSFFFMCVCVFLMFIGLYYDNTCRLRSSMIKKLDQYSIDNANIINLLCVFGLIAGVATFVEGGGFTGDLQAQRELYISGEFREVGLLSYISQFGNSLGLIGISLITWTSQKNLIKMSFALLCIFGALLQSLVTGGRIAVLIFCLPLIISLFVKHQRLIFLKYKLKFLIGAIVLGTLFVSAMSAWVYFREFSRLEFLFGRLENLSLLLDSLGIQLNSNTNLFLTYGIHRTFSSFADGIFHFSPFFEVYKPHPLLGGYQFNFIAMRFPNADWSAWKDEIEYSYRHFGMFWNVWGTFVREFIVDFGYVGALIASYLSGMFICRLEVRCLRSPLLLSLYILSLVWLVMSIFYSALVIRYFHIAIIILIIGEMFNLLFSKPKNLT